MFDESKSGLKGCNVYETYCNISHCGCWYPSPSHPVDAVDAVDDPLMLLPDRAAAGLGKHFTSLA